MKQLLLIGCYLLVVEKGTSTMFKVKNSLISIMPLNSLGLKWYANIWLFNCRYNSHVRIGYPSIGCIQIGNLTNNLVSLFYHHYTCLLHITSNSRANVKIHMYGHTHIYLCIEWWTCISYSSSSISCSKSLTICPAHLHPCGGIVGICTNHGIVFIVQIICTQHYLIGWCIILFIWVLFWSTPCIYGPICGLALWSIFRD